MYQVNIPRPQPLTVFDWFTLIFIVIFGCSMMLIGGYFTYMNEHGKSLLFKAIVEKDLAIPEGVETGKEKSGEEEKQSLTTRETMSTILASDFSTL